MARQDGGFVARLAVVIMKETEKQKRDGSGSYWEYWVRDEQENYFNVRSMDRLVSVEKLPDGGEPIAGLFRISKNVYTAQDGNARFAIDVWPAEGAVKPRVSAKDVLSRLSQPRPASAGNGAANLATAGAR